MHVCIYRHTHIFKASFFRWYIVFILGENKCLDQFFNGLNFMVQALWIYLPIILDNASGDKQSIPFIVKNKPLKLCQFSFTMQIVLDLKILQDEKFGFENEIIKWVSFSPSLLILYIYMEHSSYSSWKENLCQRQTVPGCLFIASFLVPYLSGHAVCRGADLSMELSFQPGAHRSFLLCSTHLCF